MISFLSDVGAVQYSDLLSSLGPGTGLSGPVGLTNATSNNSPGLNVGLGLDYSGDSGSPGITGGVGFFA